MIFSFFSDELKKKKIIDIFSSLEEKYRANIGWSLEDKKKFKKEYNKLAYIRFFI